MTLERKIHILNKLIQLEDNATVKLELLYILAYMKLVRIEKQLEMMNEKNG